MARVPFPPFEALSGRERDVCLTAAHYVLKCARMGGTEEDRLLICTSGLSAILSVTQFTCEKFGIVNVALKAMLECISKDGYDMFQPKYSIPDAPIFKVE